jgi:hypothetical protein
VVVMVGVAVWSFGVWDWIGLSVVIGAVRLSVWVRREEHCIGTLYC